MIEWFASHNGIEQLFLLSGLVGGSFSSSG